MEKGKVDLDAVFERVKQIYKKYHKGSLTASTDDDTNFILTSPPVPQSKSNEVWFGGV